MGYSSRQAGLPNMDLRSTPIVVFVLYLFAPHSSCFWCFGRAVCHDCGISWLSSIIFLSTMVGMDLRFTSIGIHDIMSKEFPNADILFGC